VEDTEKKKKKPRRKTGLRGILKIEKKKEGMACMFIRKPMCKEQKARERKGTENEAMPYSY